MTTHFNGFRGAAKPLDDIDLPRLGSRIGVGEDEIHAVLDVETAGGAWDARGRPKMLFEPHRLYKNLGPGPKRDAAVKAGLAYPSWGEEPYPKDSYPRLAEAMAIDETAALMSASWGLGQVLGENHAMVGHETPQSMVLALLDDADVHLEQMVAFILSAKLDDDLRAHNWSGFARGYNGPQYAKNSYHTKLAAAFARWSKIRDTPWSPTDDVIRVPVPVPRPEPVVSHEAAVRDTQPSLPATKTEQPVATAPLDLGRYHKAVGSLVGVLVGWAIGENFIPAQIAAQLSPATVDLIVTTVFGVVGTYLAPANAQRPAI